MRTANDDDAPSGSPASPAKTAMRAYVRLIEEKCVEAGLDPEDFLRVFCGELGRRGLRDMADIETALSLLQTRTGNDRTQPVTHDEDAHVE